MSKYVLYFGRFELPDKNALVHRVKANAMAIKHLGYSPILIGYTRTYSKDASEGVLESEGIEFYQVPYPSKAIEWIKDYKTYVLIEDIVNKRGAELIKAIIFTGIGPGNIKGLLRISKKYNIPIVYDVVDWFSYDQGNCVFRIYKKSEDWYIRNLLEPQIRNYICISNYLEKHYHKANRNIVVIPSLTFSSDERFNSDVKYKPSNQITICYAGSPGYRGGKDKINWVVTAFNEINPSNARLIVYGISRKDFYEQFPELLSIKNNESISFFGRRSNHECIEAIAGSDFFTFARVVDRMTTAGFPTKYSESVALHTPVVTTPTSDLNKYVINGENGFISKECTYESYKEALTNALNTSKEKRVEMHRLPSQMDESFWESKIEDFLNRLRGQC